MREVTDRTIMTYMFCLIKHTVFQVKNAIKINVGFAVVGVRRYYCVYCQWKSEIHFLAKCIYKQWIRQRLSVPRGMHIGLYATSTEGLRVNMFGIL